MGRASKGGVREVDKLFKFLIGDIALMTCTDAQVFMANKIVYFVAQGWSIADKLIYFAHIIYGHSLLGW